MGGIDNFNVPLDLSSIVKGHLNKDFIDKAEELVKCLKKGEKGEITIKVKLVRYPDMDTMLDVSYEINSKKPPIKKRQHSKD